MKLKDIAVYIHIPFCVQKCNYCDFASYANLEHHIDEYIDALENECVELSKVLSHISAKTIYIGGGTPTTLNANQLERLLKMIRKFINVDATEEFTIEANPGTISEDKLALCKAYGINRISLGVQSLQEQELQELGRIHSVKDVFQTVEQFHSYGIQNWSLDLMYGLPRQNIESWSNTLTQAISLNPTHMSIYNLKIEEETPFYNLYETGKIHLPNEDDCISMYQLSKQLLDSKEYIQYEISNFSKDNFQSKHNLVYWNNHNYLGLGSSAWSYLTNIRYQNPVLISDYINQYNSKQKASPSLLWSSMIHMKNGIQVNSLNCQMEDFVMLGLRKIEGLSIDDFNKRYGFDFEVKYRKQIEESMSKRLLKRTSEGYCLTDKGILLANEVIVAFFE